VPNLQADQLAALERFSVHVGGQSNVFSSVADVLFESGSDKLFEKVTGLSGAPSDTVAASVYMKRHGFFMAAQLHLMSEHNLLWAGDLEDVSLFIENETILFSVPATGFRSVQNREQDIRFILESYGHPVVDYLSKRAKIAKLILWENVWGYVLWMYSMLLQENSSFAQQDLDVLLKDETWKPAMRRSPFKQYLKNQQALDAMANYKRVTCCLYKELPNTEKCPYCPLVK
jgi:ferric iron reductase protein FhuF